MCLRVHDEYTCAHRGPQKHYEPCIWQLRAQRTPGVPQTEMTLAENLSRCASASTERYDYPSIACPTCVVAAEEEDKEYHAKLVEIEAFRQAERARLEALDVARRAEETRRSYSRRLVVAPERGGAGAVDLDRGETEGEQREREVVEGRESAERQYRAQGMSERRISQLLWSREERREWELREEERLARMSEVDEKDE